MCDRVVYALNISINFFAYYSTQRRYLSLDADMPRYGKTARRTKVTGVIASRWEYRVGKLLDHNQSLWVPITPEHILGRPVAPGRPCQAETALLTRYKATKSLVVRFRSIVGVRRGAARVANNDPRAHHTPNG